MTKKTVNTKPAHKKSQVETFTNPLFEKHSYTQKNFTLDEEDSKKLVCQVCSKNLKKTDPDPTNQGKMVDEKEKEKHTFNISWLCMHLLTKQHQDFTTEQERRDLEESISLLEKKKGRSSTSCRSSFIPTAKSEDEDQANIGPTLNLIDDTLPLSKDNEAHLHMDLSIFLLKSHLSFELAGPLLGF